MPSSEEPRSNTDAVIKTTNLSPTQCTSLINCNKQYGPPTRAKQYLSHTDCWKYLYQHAHNFYTFSDVLAGDSAAKNASQKLHVL